MTASSPKPRSNEPDTIEERLESFARWQKFCAFLGAGLGGLVLFGDLAKDSFGASPYWMRALFITVVVAAGISLGRAYFGYVFADSQLVKRQSKEGLANNAAVPADKEFDPLAPFVCFWIALVLGICAAVVLILAAWTPPATVPLG